MQWQSAIGPVPLIDTTVAGSSYTKVLASGTSFQDVCGELIGVVQVRPVQSPTFIPNLLWAAFRYPTDTDIDIAILLAVNTSQVRMSLLVTKLTLFSAKSVFRILLCAWISILIQELKIAKKKSKSANSSMQQATDS